MFINEVKNIKNEKDFLYWIEFYKEKIKDAQRNGKCEISWKAPEKYKEQIAAWFSANGFFTRPGYACRHKYKRGIIRW